MKNNLLFTDIKIYYMILLLILSVYESLLFIFVYYFHHYFCGTWITIINVKSDQGRALVFPMGEGDNWMNCILFC